MEANVKKELDEIEMILTRWRNSYINLIIDNTDYYLCEEFMHEIMEQAYPHICRLHEEKHITYDEMNEFLENRCYKLVKDLAEEIEKAKEKD